MYVFGVFQPHTKVHAPICHAGVLVLSIPVQYRAVFVPVDMPGAQVLELRAEILQVIIKKRLEVIDVTPSKSDVDSIGYIGYNGKSFSE